MGEKRKKPECSKRDAPSLLTESDRIVPCLNSQKEQEQDLHFLFLSNLGFHPFEYLIVVAQFLGLFKSKLDTQYEVDALQRGRRGRLKILYYNKHFVHMRTKLPPCHF